MQLCRGLTIRSAVLFAVIAIASFTSYAQAPRFEGEGFMLTMHVRGNEIRFTVYDSDLEGSPAWLHPETVPPPFSIGDAIRVSREELAQYIDDADQWRVASVELRTFARRTEWFYVVTWRTRAKGYVGDGVSIPVLMNGTAVQGEIKPDTRKQAGGERAE